MKQGSSALRKKLRTLYWAEIHMGEAMEVCRLIRKFEGPLSKKLLFGLQAGAIVSYCRSFGANQGLSALPAEFSTFPKQNQKTLHDHLIRVRNFIFAHKDVLREGEVLSATDADKLPKISVIIANDGSSEWEVNRPSPKPDFIKKVEDLCEFQRQRLNQASSRMLGNACRGNKYGAGTYILGEDFP